MGAEITFKRPDGGDAKGYLTNAARGDAPGVVVIQEWWGLAEQIKAIADRFALAGFDALAPDLYKGVVVPYHDTERAQKEMMSLNFIDATEQNVRGAVAISQAQRRQGRHRRLLHGRGGGDHRGGEDPRTDRRRLLLRDTSRAGGQAGGREESRCKAISPIATTSSRPRPSTISRRRCMRREGRRVLPLRRRSRLRQRTADGCA